MDRYLERKQSDGVLIREATEEDMSAIATLYRHYVDHTVSTFAAPGEFQPPSSFFTKWKAGRERKFPWLVAVLDHTDEDSTETISIPDDIYDPPGPASIGYLLQIELSPRSVIGATRLIGYCYVGDFRPRAGWAITVEDSIYIAPGWQGMGIGDALLSAMIEKCRVMNSGVRTIVAAISADSSNDTVGAASMRLHAKHGFTQAGRLSCCGTKYGRLLDNVFMQLQLQTPDV